MTKDNVPKCLKCKYTNTNTQIHKYANIAWVKVAVMPSMCYIFEKGNGARTSKIKFPVV